MILITGGAGYIGSHVNKLLNKKGHKTVVFDNLSRGHRELAKWGKFFEGDLARPEDIRKCFKKYKTDAVMHFAAYAYVGESMSEPGKYYQNNVVNTLNLLDVMRGFGIKRFIFSSTCSTYGDPLRIPITEKHPQNPVNAYGRTKFIVEKMLADYDRAYGIKHVNLRYFNAAGADPEGETGEWHEPETHLIPLALDAAAGKRDHVSIFGCDYKTPDGTCVRDYIHVNDLAEAHILALKLLQKTGKSDSFNLGNGRGFSVREIIETAEKITGRKIKTVPAPRRPGDPAVLIGGSAKAKRILGWKPRLNRIETIIETAWKWHKKLTTVT